MAEGDSSDPREPAFGQYEGVHYNVVILRQIRGFLVYIDGSS